VTVCVVAPALKLVFSTEPVAPSDRNQLYVTVPPEVFAGTLMIAVNVKIIGSVQVPLKLPGLTETFIPVTLKSTGRVEEPDVFVGVGVGVLVAVGVDVALGVLVAVGVDVALGVFVGLDVGVGDSPGATVIVGVFIALSELFTCFVD
jgi:hypothetical protein